MSRDKVTKRNRKLKLKVMSLEHSTLMQLTSIRSFVQIANCEHGIDSCGIKKHAKKGKLGSLQKGSGRFLVRLL